MDLEIQVRSVGDTAVVDLSGQATIGPGSDRMYSRLRELIDGGARKVLLNLGEVTQIDSSGITALVRAYVMLERAGGSLKLLSPRGRVREVLELTRLLGLIPTFEDQARALASFCQRTLP